MLLYLDPEIAPGILVNISIRALTVNLAGSAALRDVSLDIAPGGMTAVTGPNGAGKSTLLRCIYGLVPYDGQILLDGVVAPTRPGRPGADALAYLPQDLQVRSRLSVLEVVLLGKLGSLGWHVDDRDVEQARASLAVVEIGALADRPITELSLGQRQLVFMAQALIRNPRLLLLDEPTSALDLRHQLELLTLIRDIVVDRKATVLIVLHDLNLVARFADDVVLLSSGRVHGFGVPTEILTTETIGKVYGVEAEVNSRPDGTVLITPIRPIPHVSTQRAETASPGSATRRKYSHDHRS
jgi:iron complex transport system ATP-binding protein